MESGKRISILMTCVLATMITNINSQVTIGSGIVPVKAGILDIKDQKPDANNVTSKSGGIVLPRVALSNLSTLEPFMETSVDNYDNEKKIHTGLLVYNMDTSANITSGLYFWDGAKWNLLLSSSSPQKGGDTIEPSPGTKPTNPNNTDALKLANTYMVESGKTIDIPVIKAYAVWMQKLNLSKESLDGAINIELLWEDNRDLVSKVGLLDGDNKEKSIFRVFTNKGEEGNAIVVIKIANVIRWSWHIWVTNYNPNKTENQRTIKGESFMDRNLGALDNTPGDILSMGLLYQWGRKDPFVGASNTTGTTSRTLYNLNSNTKITYTKVSEEFNP